MFRAVGEGPMLVVRVRVSYKGRYLVFAGASGDVVTERVTYVPRIMRMRIQRRKLADSQYMC